MSARESPSERAVVPALGAPWPERAERPARGAARAGWRHSLRVLVPWLWLIGASLALAGVLLAEPWIVSAGAALISVGFVATDVTDIHRGGVTPMTLYAVGGAVTSAANAIGLSNQDSARRSLYFIYTAEEHLMLASLLGLAAVTLPIWGFRLVQRGHAARTLFGWLPLVHGHVPDRWLVPAGLAACAVSYTIRYLVPLWWLGTVIGVVFLLPSLVAFTLARAGSERRVPGALGVALVIALAEAVRATLFEYLRSEALIPILAYVFGILLGRRSLAPLRSRWFIPVYASLAVFVLVFGALGVVRQQGRIGIERVRTVWEQQLREPTPLAMAQADPAATRQTVLSRLTSFNQLSQIGRIVEEDGFLGGETLEYLGFAFIPRFLWPEKPLIAKGSWFAVRIGQAYVRPDGGANNSVNMTIPGELYLNFGWSGVLLGSLLFGAFLAVLWTRVRFWSEPRNTLGTAFGFYLLWVGFGMGADLQIVVTLIATYLLFVAASAVFPRMPAGR
jgi:hypothetical protein